MTTRELADKLARALRRALEESGADRNTHLCYVDRIEQILLTNYKVLDGSLQKWRDAAGATRIDTKV